MHEEKSRFKYLPMFAFSIPSSILGSKIKASLCKLGQKLQFNVSFAIVLPGSTMLATRVSGKLVWKTLETDVFTVAKARLPEALGNIRKATRTQADLNAGYATFGQAAEVYVSNVERKVDLKPRSIDYQREIIRALLKSWPELGSTKLKTITAGQCLNWASEYATKVSPSRYNNAVDAMRKVFDLGIAGGLIVKNPAADLAKKTPRPKKLELPTKAEFAALVAELRSAGAWCSEQVGDLVEFLAYSGARIGEARHVKWEDIDLNRGIIWIHGDPEHGTKNSERRALPIIEPMARLLKTMQESPRFFRDPTRQKLGYVLGIRECQKAMDRACLKLGIKRIVHHSLRHLYITTCLESGVDPATLSQWVGHRDGNLIMRNYTHIRFPHFLEMAKKVSF